MRLIEGFPVLVFALDFQSSNVPAVNLYDIGKNMRNINKGNPQFHSMVSNMSKREVDYI